MLLQKRMAVEELQDLLRVTDKTHDSLQQMATTKMIADTKAKASWLTMMITEMPSECSGYVQICSGKS